MSARRNVSKQPHQGTYIPAERCECGKRGYAERSEAKRVIKEMRRTGKLRGARVDPYLCETGSDLWHVGHADRRPARPNLNDPHLQFVDGRKA